MGNIRNLDLNKEKNMEAAYVAPKLTKENTTKTCEPISGDIRSVI